MSVLGFLSKEARELAEALAKNSGATQVATTGGSYKKAGEILEREGVLGNVLDYGAGRGHGTQFLPGNAQSYEPNPKPDYFPDFTESPDATYDGIANLNVLNVVPEPIRQEIAQDILGKLNVDGVGVVGARSYNDVMNAKNPEFLDDGGIVTSRGTYQYGFGGENEGLVEYLQRQAAENFPDREYAITPENIAATGALIKRLSSVAVPGTAGLLAAGQSEDADAGPVTAALKRAAEQGFTNRQYHASMQDFDRIVPGYNDGLFFTTPDPEFASNWAGKGKKQNRDGELDAYDRYKPQQEALYESMGSPEHGTPEYDEFTKLSTEIVQQEQNAFKTVYPLLTRTDKTFDPARDFDDLADLYTPEHLASGVSSEYPTFADALKGGNYLFYENPEVVKHLKSKGYDSMLLRESTFDEASKGGPYSTLAHFYPERNVRSQFADFAEGYSGPNIMGGLLAGGVGLGALGQSEDADAAVALGFAKNMDIDRFVNQWLKRVSREPEKSPATHLQNITHDRNYMNYDEFGAYARKQDGGKNGPTYLGAMKDHLIALSRHPKVAGDKRLRIGLTDYANSRFAQRQKFQKGMADPGLLAATAGGSAAAAGFAPWPEYKDPNAPWEAPSFTESLGGILDVLAMPMTGLQGIGRGLYGLATGEDLVTAGANAANVMGSEYKDGGVLMTPGMDSEKGATKLESWVTEKTGDPSLGWMAKMGLIFGGI